MTITGTGFHAGATVSLDGEARATVVTSGTTIVATTAAHALGTVDVVVTNPDGQSGRLIAGYTYEVIPVGPPPSITAITPDVGITDGGTYLVITGTGFGPGAIVTLAGVHLTTALHDGVLHAKTVAHPAGAVDVVVTNRDGASATRVGGYTYALPASLNVNGTWEGCAGMHCEFSLRFTIENAVLTKVSCGTSEIAFAPPPSTAAGEFSIVQSGVGSMAGRFLSPSYAEGVINIAPCGFGWEAWKK